MPRAKKIVGIEDEDITRPSISKKIDPYEERFPGGVAEIYAITDPISQNIDNRELEPWEKVKPRCTSVVLQNVYKKEGFNNLTGTPNQKEHPIDIPIWPVAARTDMLPSGNNKVLSPREVLLLLLDHESCGVTFNLRPVPQAQLDAEVGYDPKKDKILQERGKAMMNHADQFRNETAEEKQERVDAARIEKLNKFPKLPKLDDVPIEEANEEYY